MVDEGRETEDVVDRVVSRFMQVLDEVKVEGRHMRETLRRDLREAARDARRLLNEGLTNIDAFINDTRDRPVVVMTRLTRDDAQSLDLLVDAGVFESRSQCASYFIHAGLEAREDLLDKVRGTAARIKDLRDELRGSLR